MAAVTPAGGCQVPAAFERRQEPGTSPALCPSQPEGGEGRAAARGQVPRAGGMHVCLSAGRACSARRSLPARSKTLPLEGERGEALETPPRRLTWAVGLHPLLDP